MLARTICARPPQRGYAPHEEAHEVRQAVLVHGVDVGQLGDAEEENGHVLGDGGVALRATAEVEQRQCVCVCVCVCVCICVFLFVCRGQLGAEMEQLMEHS